MGIRIRKTSLRFPNSWAGGKTNPPRTNVSQLRAGKEGFDSPLASSI
ncbi:hypothetical protein HMPREF1862_00973 [Varibaculum cambriense]|uniref:Uncharacterized protein n=1 Tax=Varibaculum cambriense TaxID=184870 RepID=A0AB34X1B0_9ACTO|nr:hypothetical protein HMPREF1862_00973 [Varibaculum cambriense]